MRDVLVVVEIVRQRELRELGSGGRDYFGRRPFACEQPTADLGEHQVRFAGDDVIGQLRDGLSFGLMADLRPAHDERDVRSHSFESRDDFGRRRYIPDVNSQADDFGISRQNGFGDIDRALVDIELDDGCAAAQRAKIGEQAAQAERGVDVFRVERGQDDIGHCQRTYNGRGHSARPSIWARTG